MLLKSSKTVYLSIILALTLIGIIGIGFLVCNFGGTFYNTTCIFILVVGTWQKLFSSHHIKKSTNNQSSQQETKVQRVVRLVSYFTDSKTLCECVNWKGSLPGTSTWISDNTWA